MSVDFSTIIQNFLTAELGEEVRDSLVAIAQALQDAINAQLLTVDPDLNDTSPNAAAQSAVVGSLLNASLKFKNWVASGATGVNLGNQPPNTFCRLNGIETVDAPDDVDLLNYLGWLYSAASTTVSAQGYQNMNQLLIYPHNGAVYFRAGNVLSDDPYYRWSRWFKILGKPQLKMLVIGNSFDQDTMAYVPPILNELLPDYEITIRTLYSGSATMQNHVDWYNSNTPYTIKSTWEPDSQNWIRRNPGGTLAETLAEGWDLIALQGTSEEVATDSGTSSMLISAQKLLRILQTESQRPFAPVWFQWIGRQNGTIDSNHMFAQIDKATQRAMRELGIMDFIPVGAAFQSARSNPTLQPLGSGGNLMYSDGVHMNAGLPALLAAYTVALKILEWTGNKNIGIDKSTYLPKDSNNLSINALSLTWDSEAEATHIAGMTHGLAALGSSETEPLVYDDAGHSVTVQAVTDTVLENVKLIQRIATNAVNNSTLVDDQMAKANSLDTLISNAFVVPEWTSNTYINDQTGLVRVTDSAISSTDLIRIPQGSGVRIHAYVGSGSTVRIAKYDADKTFVGFVNYARTFDAEINDAAYVRLHYRFGNGTAAENEANLNRWVFIWIDEDGGIAHDDDLSLKLYDEVPPPNVAIETNPAALTDGTVIGAVALSNGDDETILNVSGKNIFNIDDYVDNLNGYSLIDGAGSIVKNGVTFVFKPMLGGFRIFSSGATAAASSVSNALSNKYRRNIDTHVYYSNFLFKFATDTPVTLSENLIDWNTKKPIEEPFCYGIELRVFDFSNADPADPYNFWRSLNNGVSFIAKAGVEYGVSAVVAEGWHGDVFMRPQIEIGAHSTAWEQFNGACLEGVQNTDPPENNLFQFAQADSSVSLLDRDSDGTNDLVAIYNADDDDVFLDCTPVTASGSRILAVASSINTPINGIELYYLCRFTGTGGYVYIGGIPKTNDGCIYGQVHDGIISRARDTGDGAWFYAVNGRDYAYRIIVHDGARYRGTIKPVIVRGKAALPYVRSINGITAYTNDGTDLVITTANKTNAERISDSAAITYRLNEVTGGRLLSGENNWKPMISFIDDDTTNLTYVQEYHDVLQAAGALGGYAVVTSQLDNDADLKNRLLAYEKEGFACLYHCPRQSSGADNTYYWVDDDGVAGVKPEGAAAYNESYCRRDFVAGFEKMREFGFLSWKYWITPYGVNNEFMQSLAKQYGMKCLAAFQSRKTHLMSYVTRSGNASRWNIPRVPYPYDASHAIPNAEAFPYTQADVRLKQIIDACVIDKGWLIITTHVNAWPEDPTERAQMVDYFKALIAYAQTAGMEVVPFQVGFETFRPYMDMHDLLT